MGDVGAVRWLLCDEGVSVGEDCVWGRWVVAAGGVVGVDDVVWLIVVNARGVVWDDE